MRNMFTLLYYCNYDSQNKSSGNIDKTNIRGSKMIWLHEVKIYFFLFRNVLQHRTLSGTLIVVVKIIRLKKNLFSLPLLLEREDLYSMGKTTRKRSLVFVLLVSSPI